MSEQNRGREVECDKIVFESSKYSGYLEHMNTARAAWDASRAALLESAGEFSIDWNQSFFDADIEMEKPEVKKLLGDPSLWAHGFTYGREYQHEQAKVREAALVADRDEWKRMHDAVDEAHDITRKELAALRSRIEKEENDNTDLQLKMKDLREENERLHIDNRWLMNQKALAWPYQREHYENLYQRQEAKLTEQTELLRAWQDTFDIEMNLAEHQRHRYTTTPQDAALMFEQRRILCARHERNYNMLKSILSETIGPIKVDELISKNNEKLTSHLEKKP